MTGHGRTNERPGRRGPLSGARAATTARALGALALAAALAGCVDPGRDRGRGGDGGGDVLGGVLGGGGLLGSQVSYRCDDDRRFTASFQPFGGGVSVDTGRRTHRLYPRDGDGGRDRREYRSEDGDVRLEVDGDRAEREEPAQLARQRALDRWHGATVPPSPGAAPGRLGHYPRSA